MTVLLKTKGDHFLYDQVSIYTSKLIDQGTLKPGDKVPSLRKLSKQLKVSISTVNQAYLSLEEQGVLKAKPQSGFYVSAAVSTEVALPKRTNTCCAPRKVKFGDLFEEVFAMANDTKIIPFGAAKPAMELLPVKGLIRATKRIIAHRPDACMDYSFPPGHKRLREQIALQYTKQGLLVAPDEIVITSGATEALAISLCAVASRGDVIAVESPTYFAVLKLIERLGMLALEIDTDPETGIVMESLEDALETMNVKAILVVPNFSNPMGSLMPDENKKRMIELVEEYNVPVIEDDVFGELYFGNKRPESIKKFGSSNKVLHCSSFSKTLAPGYRVGWIVAGESHNKVEELKQTLYSATAPITQLSVAEYLASGEYDRHLVRLRKAYRQQIEKGRFMIANAFPDDTRISNPQGGFVLWVQLARGTNCLDVFNMAGSKGIGITPGMLFSATRKFKNFIRINCGYPWTPENEQAIDDLADIVKELQSS